jgi:hypothetical protein
MNRKKIIVSGVICLMTACLTQAQSLSLKWIEPENYRDAVSSEHGGPKNTEAVLAELGAFFERQARSVLAEGQVLEMEVTELDLAGEYESWRGPRFQGVRVVKSLYPARVEFRYRLLGSDAGVLAEGSESLRDPLGPDGGASGVLGRTENYPYVKQLVRDWMRKLVRTGAAQNTP